MSPYACCALPTWWSWRGGCTRSHSEHGRETPQRRWYFVSRRGRVGRCQVCKSQHHIDIFSPLRTLEHSRVALAARFAFCLARKRKACHGLEQPPPTRRGHQPRGSANKKPGTPGCSSLTAGWSSPRRPAGAPLRGSANKKPGTPGCSSLIAGWSSPVARQAHNLKVAGSNPAPATKYPSDNTTKFSKP